MKGLLQYRVLVYNCLQFVIISTLIVRGKGCSCMLSHPQEHYCTADFVAIIQVKRLAKISKLERREGKEGREGRALSYQIKVKKEFKMSSKAKKALSHGLIWTSGPFHGSSLCGIKLKTHTRYLMTGTLNGEKAWISLCHFVKEISSLTKKQLKGFRRLYGLGCKCKVRQMSDKPFFYYHKSNNNLVSKNGYCNWETKWDNDYDCQGLNSMCVPIANTSSECHWVSSNSYKNCMKKRKQSFVDNNDIEREDHFIES